MKEICDDIATCDGVWAYQAADEPTFRRLAEKCGVRLPSDHEEVLRFSNGIQAFDGYLRLFGIGVSGQIDSVAWNHRECWKFAWGDRCDEYWCFGESAVGDQYAYLRSDLGLDPDPPVYVLDAYEMVAERVATFFREFLVDDFLRSARFPIDDTLADARLKLGPLDPESHLVHVPSILLSGHEDMERVRVMDARTAMICNGDIAIQLEGGVPEGVISRVETYEDERGRTRLRIEWARSDA